jgi:hypothetical protein
MLGTGRGSGQAAPRVDRYWSLWFFAGQSGAVLGSVLLEDSWLIHCPEEVLLISPTISMALASVASRASSVSPAG